MTKELEYALTELGREHRNENEAIRAGIEYVKGLLKSLCHESK